MGHVVVLWRVDGKRGRCAHAGGAGHGTAWCDVTIHGQDMSRPLGVDLGVPIERWLPLLETADSLDGEGVDTLRTRLS